LANDLNNTHERSEPREEHPSFQAEETSHPPLFKVAGLVQGDNIEIKQGAALAVMANEARIEKGGSLITVARDLEVQMGASQWLLAGEAHLEQSGSGIVITREIEAPDAKIGVVISGEVAGNLQVGVLLANHVDGNVQALVDTRTAIRFGAAFGAVLGFFLLLRRLIGGR
jgi:hypothetical protein